MRKKPHVIQFCESLHLCGDFHGQPFKLRPWQELIYRRIFGEVDSAGNRLVRRCLLLLPRKSSKTYMAATMCLYSLLCMGDNQQVISAAASQEQASRIFDAMVEIIRQDDLLSELCEVIKSQKRIVCARNSSFYVAVTSGGHSAHGYNPSTVVCDELHSWTQPKHRELFSALTTGRGARREPLTILISTQSADRNSLAFEEFEYAKKVVGRIENGEVRTDGTITNPHYLGVLYYSNLEDDWHDEKLWKRVSPALSDFVSLTEYREQHALACEMSSAAARFRQLYLNCPMDHRPKWMDLERWKECETNEFPDLEGRECYAALDLAPVDDLSSLALVFDVNGQLYVKSYAWCPAENIKERSRLERVPYDQWERQGHITATDGNSTDFNRIEADILSLSQRYNIKKLVADQAYGNILCGNLVAKGMSCDWFRQGFISMGPPVARLEKLVLDRQISFEPNPVLTYCIGNVICERDAADNQKPSNKLRARHEKIDSAVALIMAVGLWLGEQAQQPSIYETQGVMIF